MSEVDWHVATLCFDLFPLVDQEEQVRFGLTGRVFELIKGLSRSFNKLMALSIICSDRDMQSYEAQSKGILNLLNLALVWLTE